MDRATIGESFPDRGNAAFDGLDESQSAVSLESLPDELKEVIKASILATRPQLCTDIWYQDKEGGNLYVMRHGRQWALNETASVLWLMFNDGQRVDSAVEEIKKHFYGYDSGEIERSAVEFLLEAHLNRLIDLYPKPKINDPKGGVERRG